MTTTMIRYEEEAMSREDFIAGLRGLADFYESHPAVPLPSDPTVRVAVQPESRALAVAMAHELKPCQKIHDQNLFILRRQFAGMTLDLLFWRSSVCLRRIVGHKTIPAEEIPARSLPERREEIVEWDCGPLLANLTEQDTPATMESMP